MYFVFEVGVLFRLVGYNAQRFTMIAFAGGYDDFQVFDLLLILKKFGVCVAILLLSFLEAQFKLADGLFILFNLIINKEYYDLSSENK